MLRLRRQPTNVAKVGVASYVVCTIHFVVQNYPNNDNYLTTQKSSSSTLLLLLLLLIVITLSISVIFLFVEPIRQPQTYHNFADKRIFICSCHSSSTVGFFLPPGNDDAASAHDYLQSRRKGYFIIKNFGDVLSNLFIFAGGIMGIILLHVRFLHDTDDIQVLESARKWQLEVCFPILFYSTVAIAVGSTYYHWNPNDNTLLWDRLPMTLAFVSIFCFMLEEYIPKDCVGLGQSLLTPLLLLGIFSVLYWRWTDDLRLYVLIQFLPLVIIAGLLICCQPRHGGTLQHTLALMCYGLAKVCEECDYEIYAVTKNQISGHSMKHALAGMATIFIATLLI